MLLSVLSTVLVASAAVAPVGARPCKHGPTSLGLEPPVSTEGQKSPPPSPLPPGVGNQGTGPPPKRPCKHKRPPSPDIKSKEKGGHQKVGDEPSQPCPKCDKEEGPPNIPDIRPQEPPQSGADGPRPLSAPKGPGPEGVSQNTGPGGSPGPKTKDQKKCKDNKEAKETPVTPPNPRPGTNKEGPVKDDNPLQADTQTKDCILCDLPSDRVDGPPQKESTPKESKPKDVTTEEKSKLPGPLDTKKKEPVEGGGPPPSIDVQTKDCIICDLPSDKVDGVTAKNSEPDSVTAPVPPPKAGPSEEKSDRTDGGPAPAPPPDSSITPPPADKKEEPKTVQTLDEAEKHPHKDEQNKDCLKCSGTIGVIIAGNSNGNEGSPPDSKNTSPPTDNEKEPETIQNQEGAKKESHKDGKDDKKEACPKCSGTIGVIVGGGANEKGESGVPPSQTNGLGKPCPSKTAQKKPEIKPEVKAKPSRPCPKKEGKGDSNDLTKTAPEKPPPTADSTTRPCLKKARRAAPPPTV